MQYFAICSRIVHSVSTITLGLIRVPYKTCERMRNILSGAVFIHPTFQLFFSSEHIAGAVRHKSVNLSVAQLTKSEFHISTLNEVIKCQISTWLMLSFFFKQGDNSTKLHGDNWSERELKYFIRSQKSDLKQETSDKQTPLQKSVKECEPGVSQKYM